MLAIQYVRSVPRYLAARSLGRAWGGLHTSFASTARLVEIEPPALPGPRWARVRPLLTGICGSDLATITAEGSTYFAPFTSTPFVFGHEVVGTVEETGAEVEGVAVGDRVVLHPPLHCAIRGIDPPCASCRAGRTGHCLNVGDGGAVESGIQTGYCRSTGGGWSGSLVAHDLQLVPVPPGTSDEAAVLVEPLACCLHAAETAPVPEGGTALILGCGTIGLLTVTAVRAVSPEARIVAVARYPHQRAAAEGLGADEVVGTGEAMRSMLARLLDTALHRPEIGPPVSLTGADVTFDCVGSGRTLDDAMRFTRPRGTVIVVGMPGVAEGVDWTAMWHKELDVRGSYTSGQETFDRALALAGALDAPLAALVGPVFPLEEWRRAIRTALHSGTAGAVKVAFRP